MLLVAFFAALIWAATSIGVMNLSRSSVAWAAVLVAGIILGLGHVLVAFAPALSPVRSMSTSPERL